MTQCPTEQPSDIPGGPPAERKRMFENARRPQTKTDNNHKTKNESGHIDVTPKPNPDDPDAGRRKPP